MPLNGYLLLVFSTCLGCIYNLGVAGRVLPFEYCGVRSVCMPRYVNSLRGYFVGICNRKSVYRPNRFKST